ncbi:MAG: CoA pyrophosphatase [Bacteroidales bacterium]|jgi:8-oxo-dGTP pyrophosphatase MutT (NUDIX family)|nr:CoA pyrophosphatase [Bacteroidales bacterium]
MDIHSFAAGITQKMAGPLPGISSQLKMATMKRVMKDGQVVIPGNVRKAGVLVLFYPVNGGISLVLIKRAEYPGVHSGQISFPGGGMEEGDQDIIATALRETEEEIGVDSATVFPVGKLSDLFIPPSNFLVTPVVGYTLERPEFRPDPEEVDRILEVPLDHLLDENTRQEHDITIFPAVDIKVPCFYVEGNIIWGATAMMLNELIDIIIQ